MAKRGKKNGQENNFLPFLSVFLLTPLLICKLIGDLIIFLLKICFLLLFKLRKFIQSIILYITDNIKKLIIFTTIRIHLPQIYHSRQDIVSQIIYRSPTRWEKIIISVKKRRKKWGTFTIKIYDYLHSRRVKRQIKFLLLKIKYFLMGVIIITVIFSAIQIDKFVRNLPDPVTLDKRDISATTKIYDRNGILLYEIYTEQNRTPVKLSDIPQIVKQATIAIEDKDFYHHNGVSLRAIIRALYHNLTTDSLEGGSTITQQLIRSAFLTPEKTLIRKIKEIIISIWAEKLYTKDQILEMYLNQVPYGGTAWGIEAASQTYFGKSVTQLTLAQSALLAGLPASPSRYSPLGTQPQLSKKRQEEVLKLLWQQGYINSETADRAKAEKLIFKPTRTAIAAPHFVMYVKEQLENWYGAKLVETGGLRVITSLDLSLQNKTQQIVASQVDKLRKLSVGNGAALVTNPKTGEILAMVGSTDYFDISNNGNVNVTLSLRQPGSSVKVVNYAGALARGFTPTTILDDSPITYRSTGQSSYTPLNYDNRFHGKIPLRVALASSYNVPAVKVLSQIGVKSMVEQGKLMGITTWDDYSRFGLSLTLGGGEVTMTDMAKVYGALANGGLRNDLTPILKVTDYKNEELPLPNIKKNITAVKPGVAFLLSEILSDNAARTPAFGPNSKLLIPGKTAAVKTGTSDNKRDNWTIGFTPDYVVVVWVGNNDNSPMHPTLTSGVTGAAPIWQEITSELLIDKPDKPFVPPDDITSLVCYGKKEYFITGTQPKACPAKIILSPTISIQPN